MRMNDSLTRKSQAPPSFLISSSSRQQAAGGGDCSGDSNPSGAPRAAPAGRLVLLAEIHRRASWSSGQSGTIHPESESESEWSGRWSLLAPV